MNYTLDTAAAKNAMQGGRIEQNCAVIATITRAEFIESSKTGSKGMEFDCKTASGDTVQFSLWTISGKTGQNIGGYDQLMAMMTCAGVRTLTPTNGMVKKYDYDEGKQVDKSVLIAPEIMNKQVGLFLERENYVGNDGNKRYQMTFFNCFNASNKLTADEIIDKKTTPENYDKLLQRLMNRPAKWRKQDGVVQPKDDAAATGSAQANDLDDDLPF